MYFAERIPTPELDLQHITSICWYSLFWKKTEMAFGAGTGEASLFLALLALNPRALMATSHGELAWQTKRAKDDTLCASEPSWCSFRTVNRMRTFSTLTPSTNSAAGALPRAASSYCMTSLNSSAIHAEEFTELRCGLELHTSSIQ